ncbi:DoxX family protein [Vibrio atypicus]|uniref:DoxX family protein n=1 Tax=Vibrio atypicus TaxID=558271 RepID=UPI003735783F
MTIITLLLATIFLFASSIKLLGWQKFIFETQLGFFKKYGLNRQMMFAIGVIEFATAAALFSSFLLARDDLNVIGATGIAFTSVGAMFFHFRFDTWRDVIPSMVTLSLSAVLLFENRTVLMAWF